jgi:hypothetical protein
MPGNAWSWIGFLIERVLKTFKDSFLKIKKAVGF